jgi:hypothetical protein
MLPAYPQRASVHDANVASFAAMLTLSDSTWAICAENSRLAWHFSQLPHGSQAPLYANVLAPRNARVFSLGGRSTIGWRSIGSAVRYTLLARLPRIPRAKLVETSTTETQWLSANASQQMGQSDMCILAKGVCLGCLGASALCHRPIVTQP